MEKNLKLIKEFKKILEKERGPLTNRIIKYLVYIYYYYILNKSYGVKIIYCKKFIVFNLLIFY